MVDMSRSFQSYPGGGPLDGRGSAISGSGGISQEVFRTVYYVGDLQLFVGRMGRFDEKVGNSMTIPNVDSGLVAMFLFYLGVGAVFCKLEQYSSCYSAVLHQRKVHHDRYSLLTQRLPSFWHL
jgi:hypothetical protein